MGYYLVQLYHAHCDLKMTLKIFDCSIRVDLYIVSNYCALTHVLTWAKRRSKREKIEKLSARINDFTKKLFQKKIWIVKEK